MSPFDAAKEAYIAGLAEAPCPQGPGNEDQYAHDVAWYAACAAGATNEDASVIAMRLANSLGTAAA